MHLKGCIKGWPFRRTFQLHSKRYICTAHTGPPRVPRACRRGRRAFRAPRDDRGPGTPPPRAEESDEGRRVAWAAQAPALSPKRRQIDGRRRHPLAPRGLGPTQAPHRPHGCDCPEMLGGGRREEAALQGAGRPSGERLGRQSAANVRIRIYMYSAWDNVVNACYTFKRPTLFLKKLNVVQKY